MSTSLKKDVAKKFLLGNSNSLIEIDISADDPKDVDLDVGYAYLGSQYSIIQNEEEVLFNTLSSFKVISVEKKNSYTYVKLEYGVTYEMAHRYNQNKLNHLEGTQ